MEILYLMIPITLLLSGSALVACVWSIKKGQFDDIDTPALRMLTDPEDIILESNTKLCQMNSDQSIERTIA